MRLRTQVIVTIAISFTVLATLLVSINGVLATQRFHQLEDTEVADQVDRLRSILKKETNDLAAKLSDWSVWDDTWKFLHGTNPKFTADQITSSTMSGNSIEVMLFLDPQGKVVHREAVPGDGGAARSAALAQLISDTPALRPNDGTADTVVAGLFGLDQGLVLFAARPVLHADGSGPAAGTLIWVRDLTNERMENLAERLHSQVHLWRQSETPKEALDHLAGGNRGIQNDGTIAGITVLNDGLEKPTLCGQVILPRRTWHAGMITLWWQSATTILALVLTGFGAIRLLDQLITRRVRSLALQAAAGDQAQSAIHVGGHDEISEPAYPVVSPNHNG